MGRISSQKPTLNILPISSLFTQCCVPPIKKKKPVKKQISFTSNPDSSHHSTERTAKTAPITKGSTSKNMSRGSFIVKYLNDTASKVFKRTYSENSSTASFAYNNTSEIQEYLSKSLEYLHQKINSLGNGILDTTGNILPDNITSETLEELLNNYLHNYHAGNETHSVSSSEADATHLENKIFLNAKGNKKAKTFLKNFKKTSGLKIDPSIINDFITVFTTCEEINKINSAILIKQAFPNAHHEQEIANIIMNDARTYNTFMDLNKSYFKKPKNRMKNQNDKEEITNKIADFLENNPDSAMRFYKETHAIETALYTIENLQKELFPKTHIYLKENNTTDDIVSPIQETEQNFSKTRIYKEEEENRKIDNIVSVIEKRPDYTKILRITAHNYNICDLSNLEDKKFTADDQDIVDILLYFKENAQKDYKEYLQLLPANQEFYKAIQEFETSGEYPVIRPSSDVSASDASSDTASFRGSLSFRNLSLHNLQDTSEQPDIQNISEQPDISVNVAPHSSETQSHLAKIRGYREEIFLNDDTLNHIVPTILNNKSMKDILLSLYKQHSKQHNPNIVYSEKDIVTDVIHNPEKHLGINLEFHALASLKQQLESLTSEKPKGLTSLISKKPTRLEKLQKHIIDPTRELSEKHMNIYSRLLKASEDIGMSSDLLNDILKSPEKLSVYIKDKYNVESNLPVLPIQGDSVHRQESSSELIPQENPTSLQPIKTLSHSQTFPAPTSRHKKTLTLSQSFPELTPITETTEETSSAKDDTHEFKPENLFYSMWGEDLKAVLDKEQTTRTSPLQKLQSFKRLQSFKSLQSFTCGLMKPQTQESESSSDTEDFSFQEQPLSLHSSDISEHINNENELFLEDEDLNLAEMLKSKNERETITVHFPTEGTPYTVMTEYTIEPFIEQPEITSETIKSYEMAQEKNISSNVNLIEDLLNTPYDDTQRQKNFKIKSKEEIDDLLNHQLSDVLQNYYTTDMSDTKTTQNILKNIEDFSILKTQLHDIIKKYYDGNIRDKDIQKISELTQDEHQTKKLEKFVKNYAEHSLKIKFADKDIQNTFDILNTQDKYSSIKDNMEKIEKTFHNTFAYIIKEKIFHSSIAPTLHAVHTIESEAPWNEQKQAVDKIYQKEETLDDTLSILQRNIKNTMQDIMYQTANTKIKDKIEKVKQNLSSEPRNLAKATAEFFTFLIENSPLAEEISKNVPKIIFQETLIFNKTELKDVLKNYLSHNPNGLDKNTLHAITKNFNDTKAIEEFLLAMSKPVVINNNAPYTSMEITEYETNTNKTLKTKRTNGLHHTGNNTQGHVILETLQAVEEKITQEKGKEKEKEKEKVIS